MKSTDLPSPPSDADTVLEYRPADVGRNKRNLILPPKDSDARGFVDMAFWLAGFLVIGAILALAKWITTPTQ